jgi:hypothetical protein
MKYFVSLKYPVKIKQAFLLHFNSLRVGSPRNSQSVMKTELSQEIQKKL